MHILNINKMLSNAESKGTQTANGISRKVSVGCQGGSYGHFMSC